MCYFHMHLIIFKKIKDSSSHINRCQRSEPCFRIIRFNLKTSENIWKHLKTSEDIWRHLKTSEKARGTSTSVYTLCSFVYFLWNLYEMESIQRELQDSFTSNTAANVPSLKYPDSSLGNNEDIWRHLKKIGERWHRSIIKILQLLNFPFRRCKWVSDSSSFKPLPTFQAWCIRIHLWVILGNTWYTGNHRRTGKNR